MKLQHKIFTFTLITFLLSSCIFSIHPLHSPDVMEFNSNLLGIWLEPGQEPGEGVWEFLQKNGDLKKESKQTSTDGPHYKLVYSENGISYEFEAVLIKLNGQTYLDFYPDEIDFKNTMLQLTTLPCHSFAKVDIKQDEVQLSYFNYDWLSKLFEESRIRLAHETNPAGIVLTASTEELQQFVMKFGHLPEAYDGNNILKRDTRN